jgi:uncharacterized protein (UPF0335 family)
MTTNLETAANGASNAYTMTISRLTVDKLGVKLYDKVSAVMAELIANAYDADARRVLVRAPMGELLAAKAGSVLHDKGHEIVVEDDGVGMTPMQVNAFYLKVGAERRADPDRGPTSRKFQRKVMGRKGVGKLAPFGICRTIEVITSGGEEVDSVDENGKPSRGYLTAHLILDRDKVLEDTDADYHPTVGELDGTVRPTSGTLLRLKVFSHRHVPDIQDFERQLSQRFGVASPTWRIELIDNTKTTADPAAMRVVGAFSSSIEKMDGTEIRFEAQESSSVGFVTLDGFGKEVKELKPGFQHNGRFYAVRGWAAYSKQPYKDDLMAGIRIYCHGKIAAQTNIFNNKAGFHGEYDIRSYLVGEIHADWLDDEEDLIQTDRRDILWSHEVGEEFEKWGRTLVLLLGKNSRTPLKKKIWERFKDVSKIEERAKKVFPADSQREIRERVVEIAKMVGSTIRESELLDDDIVENLVQLSLNFGPHITLSEKLREAADEGTSTLAVVTSILRTARVAELSSFGLIAEERVRVIERVEALKDDPDTLEEAFQELITNAPWLIDPQWAPVSANQSFSTLKKEFQKLYKKRTGSDLNLDNFKDPNKRCDFVLAQYEGSIQIVEIKKPNHSFDAKDFVRLHQYVELMTEFLDEPGNAEFKKSFPNGFKITLVCDDVNLKKVDLTAYKALEKDRTITQLNWKSFLLKTRKMHEEFLKEAEKQRKNAGQN